jgi:hypothetical protein
LASSFFFLSIKDILMIFFYLFYFSLFLWIQEVDYLRFALRAPCYDLDEKKILGPFVEPEVKWPQPFFFFLLIWVTSQLVMGAIQLGYCDVASCPRTRQTSQMLCS